MKLSVTLLVINDEVNIQKCLDSVKSIADEIIVAVDDRTTDKSLKIAKMFTSKVFLVPHHDNFHINKKKVNERATGDWVLQLDSDEIVTSELKKEIKDLLAGKSFGYDSWASPIKRLFGKKPKVLAAPATAYYLPRRNFFLGRYLSHAGQYPDPVIRLFQNGKASLPAKDVHEQMEVDGTTGWLRGELDHYATPDFGRYLSRENRYSSLTAGKLKKIGLKITLKNTLNYLFFKPLVTFLSLYFRYRGFLDGFPGFVFSLYSGFHHAFSYMKLWELYENDKTCLPAGRIKVKIEGGEHSAGRGVGFYRNNLVSALGELDGVEVVVENSDLVHYTFFDLFYHTLPNSSDVPTVVTIHDLTPLVLPEYYPMGLRAKLNFDRQKMALKNVSAIITDSNNSKKDIVDILKIKPEKVFVTYLAVDNAYSKTPTDKTLIEVREKYHLPKKFILYVGGINANKNLVRLAKAAIKLNVHLVFVGSEFVKYPVETFSIKKILGLQSIHPEVYEFTKLMEIIKNNSQIHVLGFVGNEDLNVIYRLANLYCQPSFYEGFGLPVLEAMTAGCPVVSSNSGSLPEIYPPGAISFDPRNQADIETALQKALILKKKDRDNLIKSGQEKATEFSWEKTARETYAVYSSILNR